MNLLILCAGAVEKSWAGPKADRPLRTKGKRQAQKIGAWLGRQGLLPDVALATPDVRSRVSAEKALKAGGGTAGGLQLFPDPEKNAWKMTAAGQVCLLVVPVKTAAEILSALGVEVSLGPGVLVHLSGAHKSFEMIQRIDANDLPDLFPFPAPDGPELRERPAYYYTQSAVIPYRNTSSGTEILVAGSSSGRHWVVPKGIVEPGLTASQSAEIEAFEEAGVRGTISAQPLGSFSYEKWGASCQVTVFAMDVTRVVPDDEWEEKHRTRKWVSSKDAADLLHQAAFGDMVLQL